MKREAMFFVAKSSVLASSCASASRIELDDMLSDLTLPMDRCGLVKTYTESCNLF